MKYFQDRIDYQGFFLFDRRLIKDIVWARLAQASQAVYPAIGIHCDRTGLAFPSEETLATLTGRTEKVVRAGVKGLRDIPDFQVSNYITSHGRRGKKYMVPLVPKANWKGNAFPFHRAILEGGNWAELLPSGQALYPVMRHFGHYHYEDFEEDPNAHADGYDYTARKGDLCEAEVPILAQYAGLSRNSVIGALDDLEDKWLIQRTDGKWRVFLVPPKYFERSYLNCKRGRQET